MYVLVFEINQSIEKKLVFPLLQVLIHVIMGNIEAHDFAPVRADERKLLNLSRKVTPKQYVKVSCEAIAIFIYNN